MRGAERIGNGLGKDLCLVVPSGTAAGPVEGDREDQVDIDKMRGDGEVAAEEGAVETADGEVRVVFQGAGDAAVGALVVHQGDGVGIVHGLGAAVAFEDGVEAVGERVVGLVPEAGVGHVCGAREAEVALAKAQRSTAHDAGAGHEEVPDGTEKVNESVHFVGPPPGCVGVPKI